MNTLTTIADKALPVNQILHGDCTEILKTIPDRSVDFVLTDPPYGVGYRDRNGRSVANDDNVGNILGAFTDIHRVMKPDTLCVSFYGWPCVDAFFAAWRAAGLRPVGHIVWHKSYASKTRFLESRHEQAFVLAKGNPPLPQQPLPDVLPWQYSGNKIHPTEKAVSVLTPVIRSFTKPGDLVLDPFSGSGSTAVAAALSGRRALGIELDATYCEHARKRLDGAVRFGERAAA